MPHTEEFCAQGTCVTPCDECHQNGSSQMLRPGPCLAITKQGHAVYARPLHLCCKTGCGGGCWLLLGVRGGMRPSSGLRPSRLWLLSSLHHCCTWRGLPPSPCLALLLWGCVLHRQRLPSTALCCLCYRSVPGLLDTRWPLCSMRCCHGMLHLCILSLRRGASRGRSGHGRCCVLLSGRCSQMWLHGWN